MAENIDQSIMDKVNVWLNGNYDADTKQEIRDLLEQNPDEIIESFYRDLEFGTGGLRGIMGVGTNRMNKYTVGMSTQGLANYLKKNFANEKQIKIAIAYDCRNNSSFFAEVAANVLSANGIKVYLFDALRPTPELSFAIRHYGCHSGIVITASHNPKEYNGYKVYWNDGGQLINPHDVNVVNEARAITQIDDVKFDGNPDLIELIGDEIDEIYTDKIKDLSLSPELIAKHKDLKIVYTPIHGTGVKLVPMALKKFGFANIIGVDEQNVIDGNFPTVYSPNPEEPAALEMAIAKAKAEDADLVMASDPDSDRVGIAVRNKEKDFVLLNGNQTAALMFHYILNKWKENKKLTGNEYIVKTVVTSELLKDIADKFEVESFDVLTGFKFIADIIKRYEGKKQFIVGGEESYGYLIGDFVRDKDAVASCCFIAETAVWANEQGKSLYELLAEIYVEYDFYLESLKSIVRKGKSGAEEIQAMMDNFRANPPKSINGSDIIAIKDYLLQSSKQIKANIDTPIDLPKSNVLQFFTEDGSKITMRPSGTEPKIKFYFGVKDSLDKVEHFESKKVELQAKLDAIAADLGI
jgi:phosphoglucomutase